jgi:hypothetical protein
MQACDTRWWFDWFLVTVLLQQLSLSRHNSVFDGPGPAHTARINHFSYKVEKLDAQQWSDDTDRWMR